jgi:hypothetical protein
MVRDLGRITLGVYPRKVVGKDTSFEYDYENKAILRGPKKGRIYQERKRNGKKTIYLYFDEIIPVLPIGNQDYIALDSDEYECELIHIKKGTTILVGIGETPGGHPIVVHIGV